MYVSKSRKSKHQIMAHPGFGDVTIISGDNVVTLPQGTAITGTGQIRKDISAKLKGLTIGEAQSLNEQYGITIEPKL